MNKDDIIRMAREAGFDIDAFDRASGRNCIASYFHRIDWPLEDFAQLVASAEQKKWEDQTQVEINEAIIDEREACAKVCEVHGSMARHSVWMAEECAALIRARGQT